jgi:hypothetical protein
VISGRAASAAPLSAIARHLDNRSATLARQGHAAASLCRVL